MGEFTRDSGENHMNHDNVSMGGDSQEGWATDVPDLKADDVVRQGKDEFPCFDVDQGEFYQNMQDGRRRLRFKAGSKAQQYMSQTKYSRSFFIRHTDADGKKYVRKIK